MKYCAVKLQSCDSCKEVGINTEIKAVNQNSRSHTYTNICENVLKSRRTARIQRKVEKCREKSFPQVSPDSVLVLHVFVVVNVNYKWCAMMSTWCKLKHVTSSVYNQQQLICELTDHSELTFNELLTAGVQRELCFSKLMHRSFFFFCLRDSGFLRQKSTPTGCILIINEWNTH